MKKIKGFISKFYTGKGFYFTAALCLSLIALAVGVIYRASSNIITRVAYDTEKSTTIVTEQAEADNKQQKDPRVYEEETTATFTKESTTEKTTTAAPTEKATTNKKVTEEKKDYGNTSYMLPVTDDILKDYSDTPVYDETMGDWRAHRAIDFNCEMGTPVYASGNGKVVKVYSDTSYGYCIEIDFGDFTGRYCGLEQGTTVKVNDTVKKGDLVGNTGEIPCEKGQEPHFHFEALKGGKYTDPLKALKR